MEWKHVLPMLDDHLEVNHTVDCSALTTHNSYSSPEDAMSFKSYT